MGGAIARHAARGDRVVLCDLTRGELGSNGSPDERVAEAEAARAVLGAVERVNLALPDGVLSVDRPDQVRTVAACIRRYRPRSVAIPYWRDRHPDHEAASRLLRRAVFSAGLRRFEAEGLFTQLVESRDAQTGALAGVAFAEGFVVREPIARAGLLRDDA
jgi:LmbE family N-acetylglucosaminyl deacetylase